MKDLATQSANDTNSAADRTALQAEYDQLGAELYNIMENTKYAGETLFTGAAATGKFSAAAGVALQIGSSTAETMTVQVSGKVADLQATLGTISNQYAAVPTAGDEISTQAAANTNIDVLAGALDDIGALRAEFGATVNRLSHINNNLSNMKDNTEMAKGRIMDADFAMESANMSKNSMLMQSGISMLKQAGQMPGMVMSLLG
jgi:flagellin